MRAASHTGSFCVRSRSRNAWIHRAVPRSYRTFRTIGEYAAWMDAPMSNVLQDSELHQRLRSGCAICKPRLIGTNRVKTHWRLSHKEAWDKEVYEPCSAVLVNFAAVVPRMPPLTRFNVLSCTRSVLFANYTISTARVQRARSQSLFRIDRTRKRPST